MLTEAVENPRAVIGGEEWRKPNSLPEYEVSSRGRVRRSDTQRVRKLKENRRGYRLLAVANGRGSARNISVARLVCEAFNGSAPIAGLDVDHIDRDRSNDTPENLRWCSRRENLLNRNCASGEKHHRSVLSDYEVQQIRTAQSAKSSYHLYPHVSPRTIRDAFNKITWRHL